MADQSLVLQDIQAVQAEVLVYTAAKDQAKADADALAPLQKAVGDATAALAAAKAMADKSAQSVADAWSAVLAGLAKAESDATAVDTTAVPPMPVPAPVVAG